MTKREELEAFGEQMKKINIQTAGNLQLLEMFELWSYEISEGYILDREDVERYYHSCRLEILKRMN